MSRITGRAKKHDGTSIDYVSLFDWATGQCIAQVTPDSAGNWDYSYSVDLRIGITYVSNGCEPITHGPYDFTAVNNNHKWWRIKNVVMRLYPDTAAIIVGEIYFYDDLGNDISIGGQATASSGHTDSRGDPRNAFDKNKDTSWLNGWTANGVTPANTWIAYQFSAPVLPVRIGLVMRQDNRPTYGSEWQTADIEYSDDGINWYKHGVIEPRIATMNLNLVKTSIII